MKNTYVKRLQVLAVVILIITASAMTLHAQKFSVLYRLGSNSGDPAYPAWIGLFAQGRDGNLYSTSQSGGGKGYGTVFQLTPAGKMQVLWTITGHNAQGGLPAGGLTLGTDGNLYGTSAGGGLAYGTVFKITTSGKLTTLHNFNGNTEGETPYAPPIQGTDGSFYGTTCEGYNQVRGVVYKMTSSGKMTVLYTFSGRPGSFACPLALMQGIDGDFYGTTLGAGGGGMVFKITAHGKFTALHTFSSTDGQFATGPIIQASDGNFYGTTAKGGSNNSGTVYKMTPAGALNVLYNFTGLHGAPTAGLVQATDGKLYGAASRGGAFAVGELFQFTSKRKYTDLHNFKFRSTTGDLPEVSLFQHTDGTFYSDTYEGGLEGRNDGCGVLYSLSMGLGPFVSFVPSLSSGKVGKTIQILGQGLTGTTNVSFNRVSATFSAVSDTYLTAMVPAGATTGTVTVTTPGRKLTSNKVFRVTP